MKKSAVFTAIAAIAVCTIALSSCNEKPAGELYIHYTPEEVDAKTQAVMEDMIAHPMCPASEELIRAMLKKFEQFSYEEF